MSSTKNDVDELNRLSSEIIGAAIEVHRNLGPGLLESAYEGCLARELRQGGLDVQNQVPVPIRYKGLALDEGYRIDLPVEGKLILELKSIDKIQPIHTAQVWTYLKMTGLKMALILNFNVLLMRSGIKRIVHQL
ncbi:MAG TPA: GxxExxY protein [Burkholderiales bacterium]|jgi:GxxExxY protein|nr:GxxExxY protein [Burkholderiales bacterium]